MTTDKASTTTTAERGGWGGGGSCSIIGGSLSSLLGTHLLLELEDKYHCRQIIDCRRSVSDCLRINQEMGFEEDEGEGGNPLSNAAAAMLNLMESNLTLAATEGRTG